MKVYLQLIAMIAILSVITIGLLEILTKFIGIGYALIITYVIAQLLAVALAYGIDKEIL